jgi:hypothetical protein
VKRGLVFVAVGLLLGVAALYFALSPDYGWPFALLFTGLPAAFGLVVGVREIILARHKVPPTDG